MTRIFGSNSEAPDWMLSPFTDGSAEKTSKVRENITPSQVTEARSEIERCAKAGEKFYFGSETPDSVKRDLSEYAEVVGMPKENLEQVNSNTIRTSKEIVDATSEPAKSKAEPVQDPIFDMIPTIATNPDVFAKDDSWNIPKTAKAMNYRPDDDGIVPIRGGEDYESQQDKVVRSGENSIADPDAIESMASSDEKSSLDIIRESNEARRATGFDSDSWESEVSAKMKDSNIIPQKGTRMVESPLSQNHTSAGDYRESIASDGKTAPDRTVGETIPEINEKRAAEISREKEDDDWERVESSVGNMVTDIFFDSLEKSLDKINSDKEQ